MERIAGIREHEITLQCAVTAWIVTGLLFMLLPGTFLGAWNLIRISNLHSLSDLDPSWLQAHGHAQIFGWIGSFILGIGFYSLSKMGGTARFAVNRTWASWVLWTSGVFLRWATKPVALALALDAPTPVSAVIEMSAVTVFAANLILTFRQPPARVPAQTGVVKIGHRAAASRNV